MSNARSSKNLVGEFDLLFDALFIFGREVVLNAEVVSKLFDFLVHALRRYLRANYIGEGFGVQEVSCDENAE